MADSKITALTAISTVDPTADPLVIVDVSDTSMAASGTTKKSTINQLLGSGGTATLASATISGDLTVDTNTLKVDSANNRVGIGTATPGYNLQVGSATYASIGTSIDSITQTSHIFKGTPDAVGYEYAKILSGRESSPFTYGSFLAFYTEGKNSGTTDTSTERYKIDSTGIATWSNVGGVAGTAMTLNANGLGIGVTPSAWVSYQKSIDFGGAGNYGSVSARANFAAFATNCYFDGTNWVYKNTNPANLFEQSAGANIWRTAPSGTAGTAITFTQAMTLDASGNLLVGTTNTSPSVGVGFKANYSATLPAFSIVVNDAAGTGAAYTLYNTNAAAYRFYVANSGTIFATNTTISAISDARLKENVQDIDVGLGAILALKPRKFDWKAGKGKDIKGDRGFIAQEFEQVFPQLVDQWADEAPEGEAPYKSVRQDLIPVLVKAIQELAAEVNALKNA